jgi:hypothetical protein
MLFLLDHLCCPQSDMFFVFSIWSVSSPGLPFPYLVATWALPVLYYCNTFTQPGRTGTNGPYVVSMMPYVVPTLSHERLVTTWSMVVSIFSLLWSLLIPLYVLHALYMSPSGLVLTGLHMGPTWSLSGLYLVSSVFHPGFRTRISDTEYRIRKQLKRGEKNTFYVAINWKLVNFSNK